MNEVRGKQAQNTGFKLCFFYGYIVYWSLLLNKLFFKVLNIIIAAPDDVFSIEQLGLVRPSSQRDLI